jgi:hypothetical protein
MNDRPLLLVKILETIEDLRKDELTLLLRKAFVCLQVGVQITCRVHIVKSRRSSTYKYQMAG